MLSSGAAEWFPSRVNCPACGIVGMNAAMESFFRLLKAERVWLTRYASYQDVNANLFGYVRLYHHHRRHSTLGYLSPGLSD